MQAQNKTILITGANRGIGLELVRQLSEQPNTQILATCRNPEQATALNQLSQKNKNIKIFQLDVNHEPSIQKLIQNLQSDSKLKIDILINNAGIIGDRTEQLGNFNADNFKQVYQTNTFAPLKISELFLPVIKKSNLKTIIAISSSMGSLTENTSGGYYAYRASKAALNMTMKNFAIDHPEICVLLLHPGWVKTDMGGAGASITPQESVQGLIQVIQKTAGTLGPIQFLDYRGNTLAW